MNSTTDNQPTLPGNKHLCERLFEAYLLDVRDTVRDYIENADPRNQEALLESLAVQFNTLKALSFSGELRRMLDRANMVMLEKLREDIRCEN